MNSEKFSILIVDDEPTNISILMQILKDDYRLLAARSGEQALKRVNDIPKPDLILLDVMMPEMDGREVCRRIKEEPAHANIPIIFVTAMNQEQDEQIGLELGAIDYLTKPILPAIVKARVKNHIALISLQRQLSLQNQLLEQRVLERTAEL